MKKIVLSILATPLVWVIESHAQTQSQSQSVTVIIQPYPVTNANNIRDWNCNPYEKLVTTCTFQRRIRYQTTVTKTVTTRTTMWKSKCKRYPWD
jgi:hypothetical protein